jgi:hypothetical protein
MAVNTEPSIFYSQKELRQISKVLRTMSEIAVAESKKRVQEIAQRELDAIRSVASGRGKVAQRIADGGKVKKSSLLGEISFGFASQKFSGGATTQFNTRNDTPGNRKGIGAATEFGSKRYPQFPAWSGPMPKGPGSRGWFIYPTVRALQPTIIKEFEDVVLDIKRSGISGK